MVPSLHDLPKGCKFQGRCEAVAGQVSRQVEPELVTIGASQVGVTFRS